jgi:hypothetical protein
MKRICLTLLIFLVVCPLYADDVLAPIPIRSEFLLSAGYLTLTASSTDVAPNRRWAYELRVSSANTFAVSKQISTSLKRVNRPSTWHPDRLRAETGDVFVVDGEVQRTSLTLRRGTDRGELFVSIPILSASRAGGDRLIERFHSQFHLGNDGRRAIPRDRRFVYMKSGTRELLRTGEGQTGLGDITIGTKHSLPPIGKTALAVETLVELPTGNNEKLFGSGSADAAVNLLASRRSERSNIFAATGLTRLGENVILGVGDRTIITTMAGYSRVIVPYTSASIQMTTANTPFRGLRWPELGERFYQWSVAMQRQLHSGQVVHFALAENAIHYENSADFGVQFGISDGYHRHR